MCQPVIDDRSPDAQRKQNVRDEIALKKNIKNENRLKTYNQVKENKLIAGKDL